MNWKPSAADGVSIGEYICTGYIYGANFGWINVANGLFLPPDTLNTQTLRRRTSDSIDDLSPGLAKLRGYAYGADIGWINFETTCNSRIRFSDGRLQGHAYSANCGWINLGDGTFAVQTDTIAPGIDTDMDGMADAFEWKYFGGLGMSASTGSDGDGMSDVEEYLEGTDPMKAGDSLHVITLANTVAGPPKTNTKIDWASNVSRRYAIDTTIDLGNLVTHRLGLTLASTGARTRSFHLLASARPGSSRPQRRRSDSSACVRFGL